MHIKLTILSALCVLLNLYDIRATTIFGYRTELNPIVRKFTAKWGPLIGAIVGTGIPTLGWITACTLFELPTVLALYVGSRFTLSLLQFKVLRAMGRY